MAIPRFADQQFPDVRLTEQVVTRPSADSHRLISVNPSAGFRPYTYAGPIPVESLTKTPRKA